MTYGSGLLGPLGGRVTSTEAQWANTRTAGVWAFGDSILRNDATPLAQSLYDTTGLLLAVDAQGSRPVKGCVDALEVQVAAHGQPSRLLMAAGTNDIFDPPVVAGQVDRTLALVGPACEVTWVTVYARRWSQPVSVQIFDTQNTGWVNDQIQQAAGAHGFLLVDWHEYLCRPNSSGNLNRPGQCLSDGVHTSSAGAISRNALIVAALT